MRYAGISLEEYQRAYDKLRDAGERNMHLELLEVMADQTKERFRKAFDVEDGGESGIKPDIVADLQGLVSKILQPLEQQDLQ